jgi:hypothetical protein
LATPWQKRKKVKAAQNPTKDLSWKKWPKVAIFRGKKKLKIARFRPKLLNFRQKRARVQDIWNFIKNPVAKFG